MRHPTFDESALASSCRIRSEALRSWYIIDQPQKKKTVSLVNDEQGNGAGGNTPMSYRFRYPSVIVSQSITLMSPQKSLWQ